MPHTPTVCQNQKFWMCGKGVENADADIDVAQDASASEIIRKIAAEEKKYQEDLNKAFGSLSEGAFKQLRRQLPITRQKIEWEKVASYRLGQVSTLNLPLMEGNSSQVEVSVELG